MCLFLIAEQECISAACRRGSEKRDPARTRSKSLPAGLIAGRCGMKYHVAIKALTLSPKRISLVPKVESRGSKFGWRLLFKLTAHESELMEAV